MKKIAASLSVIGVATSCLVVSGAALDAASAAASCPNNDWANITNVLVNNNFDGSGVNIRTGDGTACTSIGQGQPGHDTVIHCYSFNGANNWTHLRDVTINKGGWVRNDQLRVVSGNPC